MNNINNSSKNHRHTGSVGSEIYRSITKDPQPRYEKGIYDVDSKLSPEHDTEHDASKNLKIESQRTDGISWKFIFLVIVVLLPIRLFVAEPFLVYGSSMEPNFDTGDYLIVDELTYKFSEPRRGDVIVLRPPYDTTKHFIKRIIGLPGETVEVKGNTVKIYNTAHPEGFVLDEPYITFKSDKESKIKLTTDQYFVMGDNRTVSFDSRSWGALPREDITGKAFLRLYPFKSISILPGDTSKFSK